MTAADAAGLMRQLDVGAIPVADGDHLKGIVTDRDIVVRVVAQRQDPADVRLDEIATRAAITISPDARLSDAGTLMAEHRIRRLLVMKGDALVGILSLGDMAEAEASKRVVGEVLAEVSESDSTLAMADRPERGAPSDGPENRAT